MWNIVISPFGMVKFKHFFFADILTSLVNPLKDVGFMSCYFVEGLWKDSTTPKAGNCPGLTNYGYSIAFLPYWFRFL